MSGNEPPGEPAPAPPPDPEPAPTPTPAPQADPLDLERLSGAIGRGVASALRELGIGTPEPQKKEPKSGDGNPGSGQPAGTGQPPKRPHWFWGD